MVEAAALAVLGFMQMEKVKDTSGSHVETLPALEGNEVYAIGVTRFGIGEAYPAIYIQKMEKRDGELRLLDNNKSEAIPVLTLKIQGEIELTEVFNTGVRLVTQASIDVFLPNAEMEQQTKYWIGC